MLEPEENTKKHRETMTCHCIFIQRQLESRGFVRQVARMEQRTIGGA
ncbi:hypothetical protein IQ15_07806, partial [Bradyrhizobium yuanmingense]